MTLENIYINNEYRIALIFRGSKFSRIAVFFNFVEIISRMCCSIRRQCAAQYVANVAQLRSVKIFAELISRMIPNSRNSQN